MVTSTRAAVASAPPDLATDRLPLVPPFSSRKQARSVLFDRSSGVADFGYGIARSHWGSGLFQEAARAVVRYGFETLGLKRIQATTRADNARSVRGVEKAGFKREAELRSFYATQSGRADAVVLAVLADEYRT